MSKLQGQVAIVTGGAKRLGRHIVCALARELKMNVVVHCGRSLTEAEVLVQELRGDGVQAAAVSADLSQPAAAAEQVFDTARTLGTPTVLINSAAVFDEALLEDVDERHVESTFAVNTYAPLMLSRQLAVSSGGADSQIINLLDWRATRPGADHLAYTASKAALAALTKGMAQQLAPRIRINGIAPGAMLPPPGADDWHDERAKDAIPLKKRGTPDDITAAVLYLLQAPFITGEILHVSGGEQL
ncbi:MAG: SDR family oxidoreductase [Planctomycetaceae bacterium]|nr:SDR family oxidoreductase [Planctomycetaceae bacterium]